MSGLLNNLYEHHQERRQRSEERRKRSDSEERREGRHGHHEDHYDSGFQGHRPHRDEDEDARRPQSYESQSQFQAHGRGYAPPAGPPSAHGPSAHPSQGGFGHGDFASDADIDRMIASGTFGEGRDGRGHESRYGMGGERGNAYERPSGPPPGQGFGERANEYGRYDEPSGPPPGRGYQSEQPHQQGYGSGGAYASGYGGGSDRQDHYGPQQTEDRPQYGAPQGHPPSHGRGQDNAPSGGFVTPRDGDGSGYGGPPSDRSEHPRRGEAASYYNQQDVSGQGDRYAHLAGIAQEHGEDPELYRRATRGLQEKIQSQARSRPPRGDDEEGDYRAHVDAHRKAYGGDDHGPMDTDAIGAAAAMEAFKQTAAAARPSNAPAGALQAGRAAQEEKEETAATRAGASGGMQDKLMALAMSHAGKLFDKKNAGTNASGGDKAQAMQSAAATAMELFTQYQSKGKLESGDMSKVIGLAMKML